MNVLQGVRPPRYAWSSLYNEQAKEINYDALPNHPYWLERVQASLLRLRDRLGDDQYLSLIDALPDTVDKLTRQSWCVAIEKAAQSESVDKDELVKIITGEDHD